MTPRKHLDDALEALASARDERDRKLLQRTILRLIVQALEQSAGALRAYSKLL